VEVLELMLADPVLPTFGLESVTMLEQRAKLAGFQLWHLGQYQPVSSGSAAPRSSSQ
jgi:hypothetical protein